MSNMNLSLSYTGSIEVKTKTRTSVAKNHGTKHLFRLLTVLLAKEKFQTTSFPASVMLYNEAVTSVMKDPIASSHTSAKLLRNPIDIIGSSETDTEQDSYSTKFTTMLDSTDLLGSSYGNTLSLALLDASPSPLILAVVEFDPQQYIIVRGGGQAYITWTMTISNGGVVPVSEEE